MTCFVDTSAVYAVLDRDEKNHARAAAAWSKLISEHRLLVSTNYVLLETISLVSARLGIDAARRFALEVVPLIDIRWIDRETHTRGLEVFLAGGKGRASLVDCTSFIVMRDSGIEEAFTLDRHFGDAGFTMVRG